MQVRADVTEGSDKLAEAIGDDTEAVVCATGFRPGWDLLAPWKVCQISIHVIVEYCNGLMQLRPLDEGFHVYMIASQHDCD